jgi:hypothetical protein
MPTTIPRELMSPLGPAARPSLVAARVFLDATLTGEWTNRALHEWFDHHLVAAGWMALPHAVHEPGMGSVLLHGAGANERDPRLAMLLECARKEILTALSGLLESPPDDRFLAGVIYAGRVRRRRLISGTEWTPHPEPTAPLSAVVLSLLAADILAHRDFYEEQLAICDVCARVVFEEGASERRRRCAEHAHPTSGTFGIHAGARGEDVDPDDEDSRRG